MKKAKFYFAAALFAGIAVLGRAQDSTLVYKLGESIVTAAKAPANAPFAISEIDSKQLQEFSRDVKELPYLFTKTPGVIAWGENGLGTGTSYLRIRGAGDSRINVTLDGVPLNSPEDQCVFWANMNSYASLLSGVQIQRGVGSSSNGDGAFGGTVALSTRIPSFAPSADVSISYGSYNSVKTTATFSSGLIGRHLIIDGGAAFSRTDGYIHGTGGLGGNWMLGAHILASDNLVIRYRNIGNIERTGQAWNGVVTGDDDLSIFDGTYGDKTGIRTYADMCKVGLGRFNNLYERLVYNEDGTFMKDAKGNYVTERYTMNDGSLWPQTTDNFIQDHNILSLAWKVNDWWKFNASLHYTYGYGYYDEFRYGNKLKKFGIQDLWNAKGKTVTDFIRQKGLRQYTYGAIASAQYTRDKVDLIIGANAQNFNANHFGYLTYIANPEIRESLPQTTAWYNGNPDKLQYYNSDAVKTDISAYAKLTYNFTSYLSAFADVQYRFVHFKTWGINDRFVKKEGGSSKTGPWVNHNLNIDNYYHFVNPKAGISFHMGGHNAFASFAMSNREPERNNFTDNGSYPAPKPEMLLDYEAGYTYSGKKFEAGVTLYYMDYKNQFVRTGKNSDIGEPLTTNIARSYRMGLEIAAAYTPVKWFTLDGNLALSRNRILDFTEVVDDWDNWEGNDWNDGKNVKGEPFDGSETISFHYDNSTLAFSPSVIAGVDATFRFLRGASASWHTSYVSRQYLDNTQNAERSLPGYTFSDIRLGYTLEILKRGLRSIDFGVTFGNIFNSHYAQSGWVYSAVAGKSGHTNDNRYTQIGFVPAAGFTCMGSIALHF